MPPSNENLLSQQLSDPSSPEQQKAFVKTPLPQGRILANEVCLTKRQLVFRLGSLKLVLNGGYILFKHFFAQFGEAHFGSVQPPR